MRDRRAVGRRLHEHGVFAGVRGAPHASALTASNNTNQGNMMHTESAELAPPPPRTRMAPVTVPGRDARTDERDDHAGHDGAGLRHATGLPEPPQTLLDAFEPSGGVVTEDGAIDILRRSSTQPESVLAQSMDERRVVRLRCGDATLLPLFQFDLPRGRLRPVIGDVVAELAPALDDVEIAQWFVQPNAWLDDRAPVQAQVDDLAAVVQAARSDRFVMLG